MNLAVRLEEKTTVLALEHALKIEEQLLLQKYITKWLSLGDGNNSFFFNQVKANWHHNKILAIQNGQGNLVTGQSAVASVAEQYFKDLLGTSNPNFSYNDMQHTIDSMRCNVIPNHKLSALTEFVSPDLIFKTLKSMKKGKAPGLDGFTAEFYIACWPIIQNDFCNAIQSFFLSNNMHTSTNSTAIALIPKIATPNNMHDFRPISLCKIPYKCISKNLANR